MSQEIARATARTKAAEERYLSAVSEYNRCLAEEIEVRRRCKAEQGSVQRFWERVTRGREVASQGGRGVKVRK